jgi:hypothetical protein
LRTRIIAHVDEDAVTNNDGLGPGQVLVDGVDAAVGQHPVCGFTWRLLAASCDERADGQPDDSIEAHLCFPQLLQWTGRTIITRFLTWVFLRLLIEYGP